MFRLKKNTWGTLSLDVRRNCFFLFFFPSSPLFTPARAPLVLVQRGRNCLKKFERIPSSPSRCLRSLFTRYSRCHSTRQFASCRRNRAHGRDAEMFPALLVSQAAINRPVYSRISITFVEATLEQTFDFYD